MAKILIIDDSRFTRLKLSTPLKKAGFEIIEAGDGAEGLKLTLEENPDCILCDLLMPVMDGFGFLESVKKENTQTPVLILTSDIQERTRQKALELGAIDLINKPPKYPEVIEKLKNLTGG